MESIYDIANQAVQALRIEQATTDQLRQQLCKYASYIPAPSAQLVQQVTDTLHKLGYFSTDDLPAVSDMLMSNTDNALRCILYMTKNAAQTHSTQSVLHADQLQVGRLIGGDKQNNGSQIYADGRQAALRILKTEL